MQMPATAGILVPLATKLGHDAVALADFARAGLNRIARIRVWFQRILKAIAAS